MKTQPIVSVCVANYNGMTVIDDCLQSILTQVNAPAIEIIVHDDASSDASVSYLRDNYPNIRLIESRQNVGFCIANNRMATVATGAYLLLLNNDAALLPDALSTLYKTAQEMTQPGILSLPQYDAQSGKLLDMGCLLDPFLNPISNLNPEKEEVGMVMGACLWIPKSLWNELGGFPEWFSSIGEDLYLCCLARLCGYPVRAVGESGYRHHVGQSFGGGKLANNNRLKTTFSRRALSERNKSMVMVLCYPTICLVVMLPLHLVTLVMEGALLTLLKRDSRIWCGIYANILPSLWKNGSKLLALRKHIQQSRRVSLKKWLAVFQVRPYKLQMLIKHGLPEIR